MRTTTPRQHHWLSAIAGILILGGMIAETFLPQSSELEGIAGIARFMLLPLMLVGLCLMVYAQLTRPTGPGQGPTVRTTTPRQHEWLSTIGPTLFLGGVIVAPVLPPLGELEGIAWIARFMLLPVMLVGLCLLIYAQITRPPG